jgi:uncharacterized membrane protein
MTTISHTIVGLYKRRTDAEKAAQELVDEGFSRDQISIVAPDSAAVTDSGTPNIGPLDNVGSGTDAGAGAAVGGFAGFMAGMAALAIPGIGPVLAVGPLAAGILGAGVGAAAGGIAGALKSHGISEHHATRYSEAVGRGGCLVMVHALENQVDHAADVLDRNSAVKVDEPEDMAETKSQPWKITSESVKAARLKPGEGVRDRQRDHERRVGIYPGITGGGTSPTS